MQRYLEHLKAVSLLVIGAGSCSADVSACQSWYVPEFFAQCCRCAFLFATTSKALVVMTSKSISGTFHSCFPSAFGCPRQARILLLFVVGHATFCLFPAQQYEFEWSKTNSVPLGIIVQQERKIKICLLPKQLRTIQVYEEVIYFKVIVFQALCFHNKFIGNVGLQGLAAPSVRGRIQLDP